MEKKKSIRALESTINELHDEVMELKEVLYYYAMKKHLLGKVPENGLKARRVLGMTSGNDRPKRD